MHKQVVARPSQEHINDPIFTSSIPRRTDSSKSVLISGAGAVAGEWAGQNGVLSAIAIPDDFGAVAEADGVFALAGEAG